MGTKKKQEKPLTKGQKALKWLEEEVKPYQKEK